VRGIFPFQNPYIIVDFRRNFPQADGKYYLFSINISYLKKKRITDGSPYLAVTWVGFNMVKV